MIAMGGNSISPKSGTGRIEEQFERTREAFDGISHFIKRGYNLCINHGNGPQVGNEIMRMELTQDTVPPLPLGVCVASTQGSIGYMIQQCLQNKLREMEIDREVVTLVSQVIVDKNDDSFKEPTKYIGKRYTKQEADEMTTDFDWHFKEQEEGKYRRVVPSPMPEYIMHGKSIKALVDRGTIVIASGGGGIPVFNNSLGKLEGLDAVIDKDYSAAKMGRIIRAHELWIITDVDAVYENFGSSNQKRVSSMTKKEAENLYDKGLFQKGSIAPKVRAAIHFLKHHGNKVIITSIPHIEDALDGSAGTEIRNEA
jgi:carbamate kinase